MDTYMPATVVKVLCTQSILILIPTLVQIYTWRNWDLKNFKYFPTVSTKLEWAGAKVGVETIHLNSLIFIYEGIQPAH